MWVDSLGSLRTRLVTRLVSFSSLWLSPSQCNKGDSTRHSCVRVVVLSERASVLDRRVGQYGASSDCDSGQQQVRSVSRRSGLTTRGATAAA